MIVRLYETTSENNVADKALTDLKAMTCDMPVSFDVSNPSFIVAGKYPNCNYVYIPYTDRYYYARATLLSNNNTKLDCHTDPLTTAYKRGNILGSTQYVARCETISNPAVIDNLIPLKNETTTYCLPYGNEIPSSTNSIIIGVIS